MADMKLFKGKNNLGESILTLRLWRFTGSAILNLVICILISAYLLPLAYMVITSVKTEDQIFRGKNAPLYPAVSREYNYQGQDYQLFEVPTAQGVKTWALVTGRPTYAEFIDPQNPGTGLIHWDGNWHKLKKLWDFSITFDAFVNVWRDGTIQTGVTNTLIVAAISEIGVLLSSIAVAYGFSRFRIPGGKWLFYMMIATILIPDTITILPTYLTFTKLITWLQHQSSLLFSFRIPWEWLPLIAPHFFSSAVFVFLLRQNFLIIPRDLDEAAMLDGAGPLQILTQVILPQSIPVVATVALLQFFYIWNEVRNVSLYLGMRQDLWLAMYSLQSGPPLTPGVSVEAMLQASALVLLVVPVIVLLVFQRFFMWNNK